MPSEFHLHVWVQGASTAGPADAQAHAAQPAASPVRCILLVGHK